MTLTFKIQYQNLIQRYNELAQGGRGDVKLFLQQRDDLVETTKNAIKSNLSPAGVLAIETRVQANKRMIKIHTTTHSMPQ